MATTATATTNDGTAAAAAVTSFDIPKKYKAVVYDKPGSISTQVVELETPTPGAGEVLVRLSHSGVCHSDLALMENSWRSYPPTPAGQVGGHEGVGVVHAVGPGCEGTGVRVGDRVGIKYVASICGNCTTCREGWEAVCPKAKYSGIFTPGTFQQYVLSAAGYVTPIPEGLGSAAAAPMLCAGLTVYAGLRKANTKSGQWVVVAGAGGGLGHIACQLAAKGMALRVVGVDHGSKKQLVRDSGAEAFVDITQHADDKSMAEEVKRICDGRGASAVIVCTASNRAYGQALGMLRVGGTMVCVGVPEQDPVLIQGCNPSAMIRGQLTIVGTAVGSQQDAIEVLDFARRGIVSSHYRLEKMEALTDVFREMSEGKLSGRVVLDLQ